MMNIQDFKNVFFVGIGGIGMSAIARYFKSLHKNVAGYDKTPTNLTKKLENEGINIHFNDNVNLIEKEFLNKKDTLIIYTPAIPKNHHELSFFTENNFIIKKRAEVLGLITQNSKGIAVAGTHGKTTVSTMIAYLLKNSHLDCDAFLGGISKNYDSNLILKDEKNTNNYVVIEADEYDKSFLNLSPEITIITSLDADHLDIYKNKSNLVDTFNTFVKKIKANGILLKKKFLPINAENLKKIKSFTYNLNKEKNTDFYAENIVLKNDFYFFDLKTFDNKILKDFSMKSAGLVNVENAIASLSIAYLLGLSKKEMQNALKNFEGIKRRFDYQINTDKIVFIDDYAHHPEELKKTILSVKKIYPNKEITGIFQPHLYSRTKDFAQDFAQSLDLLDKIILTEIYPARELPIKNVSSQLIFDNLKNKNKFLIKKDDIFKILNSEKIEVLLTLGAGSIDKLVLPIKNFLIKELK